MDQLEDFEILYALLRVCLDWQRKRVVVSSVTESSLEFISYCCGQECWRVLDQVIKNEHVSRTRVL